MTGELASVLAAEHAAIFAYGPIGAHLSGGDAAAARAAEAAHRTRRDALLLRLTADGATPPPAAAAYTLPEPVTGRAAALRVAIGVEERASSAWRAALAATTGDQRKQVLTAFTDCALRATRWRRAAGVTPLTVPFPGRP
jgi:Domain of unknown function (DUF4439)